jgi:large subunit ribosomal protein L22
MKNNLNLEAEAISRYARTSPYKVRRLLNQIKGRSCDEALLILKFMPHKVCKLIHKLLFSAISNIKQFSDVSDNELFISEARADEASFLKRFRPHAQGRGFPIKKRMCHIISSVLNSFIKRIWILN